MLNNIQVMGRLTKDPELKTTESGKTYLKYDVAVERDFTSRDGEKVTDFLPCIAFDNKSEVISKYFRKGSKIAVCGRLETDFYKDKDGNTVKNFVIVTEKLYFVESKPRQAQTHKQTDVEFADDGVPF
jgi:single-strand DNA-binding protein